MKWFNCYEVDFNSPLGYFVIDDDTDTWEFMGNRPKLGEMVFLMSNDAQTHERWKQDDAGFGCLAKVVSIRDGKDSKGGRTFKIYETDHMQRRFKNK